MAETLTIELEGIFDTGPRMERKRQSQCTDGWIVGYSTTRAEHPEGEHDGKFLVYAYKPVGEGAHSGSPSNWTCTYLRSYAKRKSAKLRAVELLADHDDDPRWARAAKGMKEKEAG